MRRLLALGLVSLGIVFAFPHTASAQGFWRWLEALSGPGPSHGWGIELVWCPKNPVAASGRRAVPLFDCGARAADGVRVTVGLSASFLEGDNTLTYAPGTPPDQIDTVRITTVTGFADAGIHRSVDVGVGAGIMRIGDLPVGSFTRGIIQPVRVSWKPLAMFSRSHRTDFVTLRFDANWIPGGLEAADFGAVPGTFQTPSGELTGSYSIVFNVLALRR